MKTEELVAAQKNSTTFTFGDSEELCDELLRLVRSGHKTATCEALIAFGPGREPMPVIGRRDIALNWDGTPALLLETLEIVERRFCDVDNILRLRKERMMIWKAGAMIIRATLSAALVLIAK